MTSDGGEVAEEDQERRSGGGGEGHRKTVLAKEPCNISALLQNVFADHPRWMEEADGPPCWG